MAGVFILKPVHIDIKKIERENIDKVQNCLMNMNKT